MSFYMRMVYVICFVISHRLLVFGIICGFVLILFNFFLNFIFLWFGMVRLLLFFLLFGYF